MSIVQKNPNTIWLGGSQTVVNDRAASEAITPGHYVLLFNNGGIIRYKKHDAAGNEDVRAVALEQSMLNLGVDDAYAANDLIEVGIGSHGASYWMFLASGQNAVAGNQLDSAGNGTLTVGTGVDGVFAALENVNNTAGPLAARIRVEVI